MPSQRYPHRAAIAFEIRSHESRDVLFVLGLPLTLAGFIAACRAAMNWGKSARTASLFGVSGWLAAMDPSFSRDPTALAIVGRDKYDRERLLLGYAGRWLPPRPKRRVLRSRPATLITAWALAPASGAASA